MKKITRFLTLLSIGFSGALFAGNSGVGGSHLAFISGVDFVSQGFPDKRIVQVKSLNQSFQEADSSGLSGASCGYHALRNGLLTAQALLNNGGDLSLLTSTAHARSLFGAKTSPWRVFVMKERFKSAAKALFKDQLVASLSSNVTCREKLFNALMYVICSASHPSIKAPDLLKDGFHYSASKKSILESLLERIHSLIETKSSHAPYLESIASYDLLEKYFSEPSIDFRITFDGDCFVGNNLVSTVENSQYGDWITTHEMQHLLKNYDSVGSFEDLSSVTIATYGENMGGSSQHGVVSEEFCQLYETYAHTKKDCLGIVLIYKSANQEKACTAKGFTSWFSSWYSSDKKTFAEHATSIASTNTNGHWIVLISARLKGEMRYYVLDSLASSACAQDRSVLEVIDQFDGRKTPAGYDHYKKQKRPFAFLKAVFSLGAVSALSYAVYRYYFA